MSEMKQFNLDLANNIKPLLIESNIRKILFEKSKTCFESEVF